mgnify:FL=1
MSYVVKKTKEAVDWVGESIEDIADFAVDDILKPIVDITTSVAQGMLDDPLTTIATITAMATGQAWAIPLIQGASTAAQGGDIRDIAIAVGASYVGAQAGSVASKSVSSAVSGAAGRIAAQAAESATRSVVMAAATGGDIKQAALSGAISGAASGTFSEGASYVRGGAEAADRATLHGGVIGSDADADYFESSAFVDNFNSATESIGFELSDIVDTWDDLPELVRNVITSGAGAAASSLSTTGELPSQEQLASVITSAAIASRTTSQYLASNTGMSDASAAQVAKIIGDVAKTAYLGADPYKAYQASISGVFQKDLDKAIDDITEGGLTAAFDRIVGSTAKYEGMLQAANGKAEVVDESANRINEILSEAQALRDGNLEGFASYEEWENGGRTDAAWESKYIATVEGLDVLRDIYGANVQLYNEALDEVAEAKEGMFTDQQYLDTASAPAITIVTKAFTETIRPDFNEEEYREIYSIPSDEDAHAHWLNTGRVNSVTRKEHTTAVDTAIGNALQGPILALEGSKFENLEGLQNIQRGLTDAIKSIVGDDLTAARNLDLSKGAMAAGRALPTPIIEAVSSYINNLPDLYTENRLTKPVAKAAGTTDADIASNKARRVLSGKLPGSDPATDAFTFTVADFNVAPLEFNPKYNQRVSTSYSPIESKLIIIGEDNEEITRYPYPSNQTGLTPEALKGMPPSNVTVEPLPPLIEAGTVPPATPEATWDASTGYSRAEWKAIQLANAGAPEEEVAAAYQLHFSPTLAEIAKINGPEALETASRLNISPEALASLDSTDRMLIDFGLMVKTVTQWGVDKEVDVRKQLGLGDDGTDKEIAARAWTRNFQRDMGNIVEAGGELYKEWSGMSALVGVDPRSLSSNAAAKLLISIGASTKPEDYKATLALFNKAYRDNDPESETYREIIGDGILGKAESIALAMADPEFREVVLHDIIIKELITELPTIAAAVATGGVAGVAVAGAKKGAQKFARDAAEAEAKKIAQRTAISTGAVLNAGEEASSAAGQAYEMIYDAAIEGGKSDAEATKLAHNGAIVQGSISAAITVPLSFMPGNPAKELIKTAFGGKKRLGELVALVPKIVGKYTLGTAAEIGEEVIQEAGIQTYYLAKMVRDINPNASVFKEGGAFYDMDGALAHAAVYSAVASGGTSTLLNATNMGINLVDAIPAWGNRFKEYTTPQALLPSPDSGNTNNPAANALIAFNPTINQATNDAGSSNPEVRAAGEATIKQTFGYDPNYQFDGTTIDATQDPDGVFRFNTAVDILNSVNNNSYNTSNEVGAGFSGNTENIPFVATPADVQRFVGAAPAVTQAPNALPATNSDVLQAGIDDYINQNYTDANEVAGYFAQYGYEPSQAEIDQYVGQGLETEQAANIIPYVDPRQTTTDEVLDYFTSLGYNAEDAEAALFGGQGAEDFQTSQFAAADLYQQPRNVTRPEVEQFFADQNYTPTEDDITRFIAQANDPNTQTTQAELLAKEFDPLAVTESEARKAYETAGFSNALPADVERLTGQYAESELDERVREALPTATYNSIADMLGKRGQEVTDSDIDFVMDIIAQQEVLADPTPLTQQQLQYDVNADNVIDTTDQTMLQQVKAGTVPQTQLAPTSQFASTGIQGQMQRQMQTQQQIETQMQQQMQQQIQTQEANRVQKQAEQAQQAYMQQLFKPSPVEVKTPDPASIDYVYDPFGESIFATPEQEAAFVSPFSQTKVAQGGIISALGGRR